MKALTVEWVYPHFIKDKPEQQLNTVDIARLKDVPVVRLAEVDAVLAEAVWAMELLQCMPPHRFADESLNRIQAFLARPDVAAWRERQKKET